MKFRVHTLDSGCIEQFSNIVHLVAGLTKHAILRLTKSNLCFVIKERAVYGGVSAWCELDYSLLFAERVCDGLSPEQDEIVLEIVLDHLTHCLRIGSAGSSGGTNAFSTSMSAVVPTAAGLWQSTGSTSAGYGIHNSSPVLHGLKIKLVRRKVPCLAFELEQASVTGRSRAVWHFIPVHVVPPRLWDEFMEPPDPDFDVSIFLPSIKTLRPFVDRMKRFAKFIILCANGSGELTLGVHVETLAKVRLMFRGLRARNWRPVASFRSRRTVNDDPDGDAHSTVYDAEATTARDDSRDSDRNVGDANCERMDDLTTFSVSLDIRRFGQLLSAPRFTPSFLVCNIVHEHLAQFVMLCDHCKLKYNMPAFNL